MRLKSRRLALAAGALTGLGAVGAGGFLGLVTGRVTIDLGVGRRTRPLGPLVVDIAAPRAVVYAAATAPYAPRQPRGMREKVQVLQRGDGMVLAAHYTPIGARGGTRRARGLVAVTVEAVTFDPPARIGFRLVRGPVPHLTETFELTETHAGTRLSYTGELGTDLGPIGEHWGDLVARSWVATVAASLDDIHVESERRAR